MRRRTDKTMAKKKGKRKISDMCMLTHCSGRCVFDLYIQRESLTCARWLVVDLSVNSNFLLHFSFCHDIAEICVESGEIQSFKQSLKFSNNLSKSKLKPCIEIFNMKHDDICHFLQKYLLTAPDHYLMKNVTN